MNTKKILGLPSPYRRIAQFEILQTKESANISILVERFTSPTAGCPEVYAVTDSDGVRGVSKTEYVSLVKSSL